MSLPKFSLSDGSGSYVWEEYPSLPGDQADLTTPVSFNSFIIEHKRNNVIIGRSVLVTKNFWDLFFKNISKTMVDNFQGFADEDKIRFYPDAATGFYWNVYWMSAWRPKLQRGGTYNFSVELLEV